MEVEKMNNYDDLLVQEEDAQDEDDGQIKKNLGFGDAVTYVGFIADHSGSMSEPVNKIDISTPRKSDLAMSNYNEQLATLKKESEEGMETIITVVEFDNEITCPHLNVNVMDLRPLEEYWTRGMTSLYDAIAFGISKIKRQMDEDDRDNKAALIIVETDGYENSSQDYPTGEEGRSKLKKLIEELEATGRWTFTFLGAGLDEKFAADIGMAAGNIRSTQAGNVDDVLYAYSAQNIGTKSFMDDRKKGILAKKDFYAGDPTDKKWETKDTKEEK